MRRSRELLFALTALALPLTTSSCWSARCYGSKADRLPDFTIQKAHQYHTGRDYCDVVDGNLRVTVVNKGFADGSCAVLVEYANGDWAITRTEEIPHGESRAVLLPMPTPWPQGGMSFRLTVNPGDEVAEHQYGDNVAIGYCKKKR